MFADRTVVLLLIAAAVLTGLALAGLSAVITSAVGVVGIGLAVWSERQEARSRDVGIGDLHRPPSVRYVLVALPFLVVLSAAGESHLLAAAGGALLSQAAYARVHRAQLDA